MLIACRMHKLIDGLSSSSSSFINIAQGRVRSVAEAMRAAVTSLLDDHTLSFGKSYYYWAGFLPHGCAQVELDALTLSTIKSFVESEEHDAREKDQSSV